MTQTMCTDPVRPGPASQRALPTIWPITPADSGLPDGRTVVISDCAARRAPLALVNSTVSRHD
ncbi:hypothetical protein [Mycobacterium haemophilum]|uniref:hypothetical protein n=1 Tax=Mycobacterium haemophilum TaxID=29311 RepID=UPI0018CED1E5|nr:hypothetical protein [Mycobacterium haemophilum]